jgi:mannose-1-phosphate guanylyltransferase
MARIPPAHAFILAGGRGTRFWPLSRHARPKQLLDFNGEGALLALTVERVSTLIPPERLWILTSEDLADQVRSLVPAVPREQIIAEPMGRNTAPAVGLAAALLLERAEDVPFAVLPSDHLIHPTDRFRDCLSRAIEAAASTDLLLTFGVRPTRAETGYGYIEAGPELGGHGSIRAVAAFREKPDRSTAEEYLESGRHLWNSGMFVWRASVLAEGLERSTPGLVEPLRRLVRLGHRPGTAAFQGAFKSTYGSLPSISIDYALLEKASNVAVVPADFEWNDVGHWLAMRELWARDAAGNAVRGELLQIDACDNIVLGPGRLTALVGVDNLVIVQTEDATLVCAADRAQDVRLILERLREEGRTRYL